MARGRGLTVVKLGGSLARSARLLKWLEMIAGAGGSCVLVPGGGPFADQVLALQRRWGFDDSLAHHLALVAMEQFGRVLAALEPGLEPAASRAAIRRALLQGRVPVWMPTAMALADPAIPQSWDVTSDSLALWLGDTLKARRLILIKSAAPSHGTTSAAKLSTAGLVDRAFPAFLARSRCRVSCVGPGAYRAVAAALASGADAGIRMTVDG